MAYRYRGGISFGPPLTPAVKMVILWTAIFYMLQLLVGRSLIAWAGLIPYDVVTRGFIWQPVTYMFLHGGFFHILFNMFALWRFGSELELLWGTRRWVRYYFLTGIGAGLTTIAFAWAAFLFGFGDPRAVFIPTIGASGAVYGILLAYGMIFPNRPVYLYFFFPIPAKIFVLFMGLIAFFSSISFVNDGIGHFAHLGGMVFGYFYLKGWPGGGLFRRWPWRRRRLRVISWEDDEDRRRRWP